MTAPALEMKGTRLNAVHRKMGGRMVEFGGWNMPVQYPAGTVEEHVRTRTHAGSSSSSDSGARSRRWLIFAVPAPESLQRSSVGAYSTR